MSDDSNSLAREFNNGGTHEPIEAAGEVDGPEHVKQPKQSAKWMGRMGRVAVTTHEELEGQS